MTRKTFATTLAAVVTLALMVSGGPVGASEEIAEQESLVCTTCHDKPGSRLLTDQGKYYELMSSMNGFTEVKTSFEKCTYCHVKKPGSRKLTRKGEMFSIVVGDMEGLRNWVTAEHPGWPFPLEEPEKGVDDKDSKGSDKE